MSEPKSRLTLLPLSINELPKKNKISTETPPPATGLSSLLLQFTQTLASAGESIAIGETERERERGKYSHEEHRSVLL
jgi:hypothetical protein